MKSKKFTLLALFCLYSLFGYTQKGKDTGPLERIAEFQIIDLGNNTFEFRSAADDLEVLPTAGATQAPSFGHYWEFGDGHFSFDENPTHTYTYAPDGDAILYLTNNYDNGELPKEKPKRPGVAVASLDGGPVLSTSYLPSDTLLLLQNNHDPKPNERMVCILSYKNPLPQAATGKLYLFFNETTYSAAHFELAEERLHFGETRDYSISNENLISGTTFGESVEFLASTHHLTVGIETTYYSDEVNQALAEARNQYQEVLAWDTGLMRGDEERNLFTTLNTTAAMLKDTTATVTIKGVFVPEGGDSYTESILEMAIVSAHDPNNISVSKTRANYRNIANKEITYTVHFQNTAEGSADSITIDCTIPKGMDIQTVQLKKTHLKKTCPPCSEINYQGESCISQKIINENLVRFIFHHIQLPGKKDAVNKNDTKGYIKYEIKPNKKIKKLTQRSRADIYFDKEEAVVTNFSATRFKPGLSIGLKGGYNYFSAGESVDYYFGGLTVSPFKSYKLYYQAELMLGRWRFDNQSLVSNTIAVSDAAGVVTKVNVDSVKNIWTEYYSWDLVPLQLRKNVTDFLAIGIGGQISARMGKFTNKTRVVQTTSEGIPFAEDQMIPMTITRNTELLPSLFVDLSLGLVRVGPELGLRYHLGLGESQDNFLQMALVWKI